MTTGCDLMRVSLGAYALGALDGAECARIEAHVARCSRCRGELDELGGVSGLLALVPSDQVDGLGVQGPELRRGSSLRRWRARRVLAATAAVAALAAASVGVASLVADRGANERGAVTARAVDRATGVSARALLLPRGWGTQAVLHLHGVRPHQRCRLIVVARDGTRETASTWRADYEGTADVRGASAIELSAIASLEVVAGRQGRLVRMIVPRSGRHT
jgi:hypothetical protein